MGKKIKKEPVILDNEIDLEKYPGKSNKCKICQASYQTKQGLWSQKTGKADACLPYH